ncbi:MAG: response regulator transcription factor [Saprospiraceae bacterium]|nr:response regulator transcription factor [Saprospiraceae bacterium]
MIINCLIVDDEPLARKVVEGYVQEHPNLYLKACCKNAIQAGEILQKEAIDLIFLDINMPRLNGISFLKTLERMPKVIMTTAYREYAVEGFELAVSDYLMKPISFERFLKAINRVLKEVNNYPITEKSLNSISDKNLSQIFIRVENKIVKVALQDILYFEAYGNYVKIHTTDGKRHLTKRSLGEFEAMLPLEHFIKVHRSYLVAFPHIDNLEGNLLDIGGQRIQVSRQYRAILLDRMNTT